jgi:O-methyltransferase
MISTELRLMNRYLNLLEKSLTGSLVGDAAMDQWTGPKFEPKARQLGRDWPSLAQTMIGEARMKNLRQCCESVILDEVPGDFIETGVWRGGASIFMKGILEAYGDRSRRLFVADSFQGLPPPNPGEFPADAGDVHHTFTQLAIPKAEVENNFRKYGLLDERVIFLEGWFKDTLPTAPIDQIAILRLDGDMYESTIQALDALYRKVAFGGYVIVDDFGLQGCNKAIGDFRTKHAIDSIIFPIDGMAAWWRVDHPPIA